MRSIWICGVRIDDLTREAAVEAALHHKVRPCLVMTPNAVMLERARRDGEARALLSRATLSLPDGAGVLCAARRLGTPLRERVAGIAFGEALLSRAAREGRGVFLLGGRPGIAERAAERLCAHIPGLCIAGTRDGYFEKSEEGNRAVTEEIRRSGAEILLVCFGFPLQEQWILQNEQALSRLFVIAALGGSLDVWAGAVKRAPRLLSHVGLEWAWRMLLEPKRLRHAPALLRFALLPRRALDGFV